MIIESIGSSLIIGLLRGGKFSNMKDAEIRKWYFIVASFFVEFTAVFLTEKGYHMVGNYIFFIHLLSYSLLFIGISFNLNSLSFKLILLGTLLNFIVIMLNGGQMPVSEAGMLKAGLGEDLKALLQGDIVTHTIITKNTILHFLGDIFVLPKPYPRPKVFSVGDVFMAVGVFVFLQECMIKKAVKRTLSSKSI